MRLLWRVAGSSYNIVSIRYAKANEYTRKGALTGESASGARLSWTYIHNQNFIAVRPGQAHKGHFRIVLQSLVLFK